MKKSLLIIIAVIFLFTGCKEKSSSSKQDDFFSALKTGDVIFQKLPSELSRVISEVTKSELSHCGMIIRTDDKTLKVIEAVGPVRIIPIDDFINNGIDKKFAVIRLKDVSAIDFDAVVDESKKFLNRPYDFQYRFDDEYIYCSELVYKAYLNAENIKIAKVVKLKELNYKDNIPFIKSLTGGDVPLEREMVTPVDLYNSNKFEKLFSNFD
ncbi:YiiX/YebB-like N1pC/P60 family cysteine hydrolase [Thermodesulfobacteriota bacterium]